MKKRGRQILQKQRYYSLFSIELYINVSVFDLKKTLHCLQGINAIYARWFLIYARKKDRRKICYNAF